MASSRYHLRERAYLIGYIEPHITGNKLPTNAQVLKSIFYNTRRLNMSLSKSIKKVNKEVKFYWQKAQIPIQGQYRCLRKMFKLHNEYRSLQKDLNKPGHKERENLFQQNLEVIFDIAMSNVLETVTEELKQFLMDQRSIHRHQVIPGLTPETIPDDEVSELVKADQNVPLPKQIATSNEGAKNIPSLDTKNETVDQLSEQLNRTLSQEMSSDSQGPEQQVSQRSVGSNYKPAGRYYETNNVRGTINVMTEKVVAAFDTCKLSYRKSVHIIAAVAEALDVDTDNIIMNKTSFNDWRNRIREERAEKAKQLFQNSEITSGIIHWDGKVMPDNASGTQVDRLPIVITNGQTEKILDVPALDDGKGVTQATAVYDALYKWGLNDSIKGLCCDTTYSNLGPRNGAAPLLEQLLDRDLLYLPCRHHIYEIVLKSCFEVKIPGTSGPDVPLFKRFSNAWPNIDKTKFKSGLEDKDIHQTLAGKVPEIKSFLQQTLKKSFIRDDYKEMLELCDVFLGGNSVVKFRKPGAYHHARWMAKAIYTLKIYLFRDEFRLKPNEKNGLFDVCLFVVFMYAKPWITAPLAVKAPKTDLEFVKNLLEYENIDSNIASCALNKIKNHLWYLGPELSVLSLFDDDIPSHTKREIINAMNSGTEYEIANIQKKFFINSKDNLQDLKNKDIDYFVNSQSLHLFDRFDISKEFLKQDIETWSENEDYLKALSVFVKLHVVNDCAERIVHLTQDYINVLTKDESQKQYLLRVVEDYRKQYPDSTKKTLTKRMTDA